MTITPSQKKLLEEMLNNRSFSAYYYSFNPTGNEAIDLVLSAVAIAGKRYHHTGHWADDGDEDGVEVSNEQLIQYAADKANTYLLST